VLLGDEYLMSSAFAVAEEALARLALAQLTEDDLHVVVGGLGLRLHRRGSARRSARDFDLCP
jgi:hypothetical protein